VEAGGREPQAAKEFHRLHVSGSDETRGPELGIEDFEMKPERSRGRLHEPGDILQ